MLFGALRLRLTHPTVAKDIVGMLFGALRLRLTHPTVAKDKLITHYLIRCLERGNQNVDSKISKNPTYRGFTPAWG
jgi:hypothetical protein